jgi:hypothetical protein
MCHLRLCEQHAGTRHLLYFAQPGFSVRTSIWWLSNHQREQFRSGICSHCERNQPSHFFCEWRRNQSVSIARRHAPGRSHLHSEEPRHIRRWIVLRGRWGERIIHVDHHWLKLQRKSPALGWASQLTIRNLRGCLRAVLIKRCDQIGCDRASIARFNLMPLHHVHQLAVSQNADAG